MTVLYSAVTKIQIGYLNSRDTEQMTVILQVASELADADIKRIGNWMEKRLETENIVVYQSLEGILYPMGSRTKEDENTEDKEVNDENGNEGTDQPNERKDEAE